MMSVQSPTTATTDPATNGPGHVFARQVGTIHVEPQGEPQLTLGTFDYENPAKGFSIDITSTGNLEQVATHITAVPSFNGYELVLQIANTGETPAIVEVWAL